MNQLLLILFVILVSTFIADAQISETISKLTPIAPNIGKFPKRLPVIRGRFNDKDNLKFAISVKPANLPDNRTTVAVTIKILYKEITFDTTTVLATSKLKIYGRITSKDRATDGLFEENLSESAPVEEVVREIAREVGLHKMFELSEGDYQIGIIISDIITGNRGIKIIKFKVPPSSNTK